MGTRSDDRELKRDRGRVVPPLGLEGGLVTTQGKVDVLPFMDTGVGEGRGNEIDIDGRRAGEARCVPGNVDGIGARDGHPCSRVGIESAGSAS